MARLKENDLLASSMGNIMSGEGHKAMFAKPTIKTAAPKETHPIEQAFNKLILASEKLEELNLEKSAGKLLNIAELISKTSGNDFWDDEVRSGFFEPMEDGPIKNKPFDKKDHDWTELNDYLGDVNSRLSDDEVGDPLDIVNQRLKSDVDLENISEENIDLDSEYPTDYNNEEFDLDKEYSNLFDDQDTSDKHSVHKQPKSNELNEMLDFEDEVNQSEEEKWFDRIIEKEDTERDLDSEDDLYDLLRDYK